MFFSCFECLRWRWLIGIFHSSFFIHLSLYSPLLFTSIRLTSSLTLHSVLSYQIKAKLQKLLLQLRQSDLRDLRCQRYWLLTPCWKDQEEVDWCIQGTIHRCRHGDNRRVGVTRTNLSFTLFCFIIDNFFIEFPPTATARQRAGLLGALFFIDYLYYEDGGCHILHYLGAPLAGPCACLGYCGNLAQCLCESAADAN